eukprot:g422.t1
MSLGCMHVRVRSVHSPVLAGRFQRRIQPTRRPQCTKKERTEIIKNDDEEEDDMYFGDLFEKGGDPRYFGENIDPTVPLPPEYESDFWESPAFGFIGKAMSYFVPVIITLALVVGGIAAKSFNEGATSYLTP